jgi:hypothetical protein
MTAVMIQSGRSAMGQKTQFVSSVQRDGGERKAAGRRRGELDLQVLKRRSLRLRVMGLWLNHAMGWDDRCEVQVWSSSRQHRKRRGGPPETPKAGNKSVTLYPLRPDQ